LGRAIASARAKRWGTRIYDADRQNPVNKVLVLGGYRGHMNYLFDHLRMEIDKDGKKEYTVDSYGFGSRECLETLLKIIDAGWGVGISGHSLWFPGSTARIGFRPPQEEGHP
jgi:hypothetical protein